MLALNQLSAKFLFCSEDGKIIEIDPRLLAEGPRFKETVEHLVNRYCNHREEKLIELTEAGVLELCRINNDRFNGYVGFVHTPESRNELYKKFVDIDRELEGVFDSSHDGVVVSDENGVFIRANKSYERITGLSMGDLLGRSAAECVQSGTLSDSVTLRVLESGKPVTFHQEYSSGCESIITGSPVLNDEGKVVRVVTNVRDMTEIQKLKLELAESKKKLENYSRIVETLTEKEMAADRLIFRSEKIRTIRDRAVKFAKVDVPLLITGESGVGKEAVADLVYKNSLRKSAPFLKINCGAIPENLLESELFGYDGGAFTGAEKKGRVGLLEMAAGGMVMLDEIGELPLSLQVKLLRVIEQQEFFRVGGKTVIKVDVRIVAATNRNLQEMVNQKTFRADLYYRLNVLEIHIPALRERPEDIIPITNYFIKKLTEKHHMKKHLSADLYRRLIDYSWPGNVRELGNLIERLVVTCDCEEITADYLPEEIWGTKIISSLAKDGEQLSYKQAKERFEQVFFQQAISKYRSARRTAERLGLDHSTIVKKAAKYGIRLLSRWN